MSTTYNHCVRLRLSSDLRQVVFGQVPHQRLESLVLNLAALGTLRKKEKAVLLSMLITYNDCFGHRFEFWESFTFTQKGLPAYLSF